MDAQTAKRKTPEEFAHTLNESFAVRGYTEMAATFDESGVTFGGSVSPDDADDVVGLVQKQAAKEGIPVSIPQRFEGSGSDDEARIVFLSLVDVMPLVAAGAERAFTSPTERFDLDQPAPDAELCSAALQIPDSGDIALLSSKDATKKILDPSTSDEEAEQLLTQLKGRTRHDGGRDLLIEIRAQRAANLGRPLDLSAAFLPAGHENGPQN